jgi:hypothetical protein
MTDPNPIPTPSTADATARKVRARQSSFTSLIRGTSSGWLATSGSST